MNDPEPKGMFLEIILLISPGSMEQARHRNQKEFNIYGSLRLGTIHPGRIVGSNNINLLDELTTSSSRLIKNYELSNHLGNILNTVSDQKTAVDGDDPDDLPDSYRPSILSRSDYYPFGLEMPGRTETFGDLQSRFGFNGKEKDSHLHSTLTHYDYGFRIYNPAIGRFLSVDPLTNNYPAWSPYPFAMNRTIDGIDLDGLEYLRYEESIFELRNGSAFIKKKYLPNETLVTGTNENGPYMTTNREYSHFIFEPSMSNEENYFGLDPSYDPKPSLMPYVDWMDQMKPGRRTKNSETQFNPNGNWDRRQTRRLSDWHELTSANPPAGSVGLGRIFLVANVFQLGSEAMNNIKEWNFISDFESQSNVMLEAIESVNIALRIPGLIPDSQRNNKDIFEIANFVFHGERNIDPKNLEIGIFLTKYISKNYKPLFIDNYSPEGMDNYNNIDIPIYKHE
jgi:RHS repeat-associated protein